MRKLIFIAFVLGIVACKHETKPKEESIKCLNDTMLKAIELDTVKSSLVQHELKLTGKVSFDQENTQKIFPLASGRVVKVNVENGDFVKKGDVLAVVNSSEAADYESQLSAAESRMIIAERNKNAVNDMYKDGLSSERELVSARKEYDVAAAEYHKQQQYQKIFSRSGVSTYTVRAPISGYIVEKNINPEFYIRTDDNVSIFTISNISIMKSNIFKFFIFNEISILNINNNIFNFIMVYFKMLYIIIIIIIMNNNNNDNN